MLRALESDVRVEYADAVRGVANEELARSNYDRAEEDGKRALEVAPGYAPVRRFLESVDIARQEAEDLRNLRLARERRGGK